MLLNSLARLVAGAVLAAPVFAAPHSQQPAKNAGVVHARANEVPNPFGKEGEEATSSYMIGVSSDSKPFRFSEVYDIKTPGEAGNMLEVMALARLAFEDSRMTILQVREGEDRNTGDKKKALRDLYMGAWVHTAGKSTADLKSISYENVEDMSVQRAAEEAYHKTYPDDAEFEEAWNGEGPLEVTKHDKGGKLEAFERMNEDESTNGANAIATDIKKVLGYYYDAREIWRWTITRTQSDIGMMTTVEVHF